MRQRRVPEPFENMPSWGIRAVNFWNHCRSRNAAIPGATLHCEIGDDEHGQVVALGSDGRLGGLGLAADTKCQAAADGACHCRVGESIKNSGQRVPHAHIGQQDHIPVR